MAKVCKSDQGGEWISQNQWTTFQKTRLNCSFPGAFPFYFNFLRKLSLLYPFMHLISYPPFLYPLFPGPGGGGGDELLHCGKAATNKITTCRAWVSSYMTDLLSWQKRKCFMPNHRRLRNSPLPPPMVSLPASACPQLFNGSLSESEENILIPRIISLTREKEMGLSHLPLLFPPYTLSLVLISCFYRV